MYSKVIISNKFTMSITDKIKVNAQQKIAIEHGNGPLLIVAGAGTGKTTVLTQRVLHLIESENLAPDEILALTFTEKAAAEMQDRIDRELPFGYGDLWVMTFHSFAQKILERDGIDLGLPAKFKVLDESGAFMMMRKNLDRFDLDYYKPLGNPSKFIKELLKHFSRCKDELISPQEYLDYAQKLRLNNDNSDDEGIDFEIKKISELASAYHTYEQLLLDNDSLDFGDLITYCIKLFKERPNILKKYRELFKYILVDEFQDTNYAQYELIKMLAHPKNNITVVGDDDQSIYAFRGSSMNNILGFKKDYGDAKEVLLTKNYRSAQNILDLSYNFIQQNNPERLEIKLSEGMPSGKKLSKKLGSQVDYVGEIAVIQGSDENDEARKIIEKIYEILKVDTDNLSWNDFAILTRANASAKPIIGALKSANIPYQYIASSGLYEKEIIVDIVSYLRLLDNYHESSAMWRVLNFRFWQIPTRDAVNISHMARKKSISIYEIIRNPRVYLKLSSDTEKKLKTINELIEKHTDLALKENIWAIVWTFLNDSGYLKWIDSQDEFQKQEIFSYLNQFYKKIQLFIRESDSINVKDFLIFFDMELESGDSGKLTSDVDDGPEGIKVMTVHGAKGLEFKYVFIICLVDKRFPSMERGEAISIPDKLIREVIPGGDVHLQEERRLFYVAMTRAKKGLYFTWALDYGGTREKKPSRFLHELELIKIEEEFIRENKNVFLSGVFEDLSDETIRKEDFKKLLPKQYSFSQLKAYETCPRQYYYSHILKIPVSGKGQFSYGKTMHLVLQKFFQLYLLRKNNNQSSLFESNKKNNSEDKVFVSREELFKLYEESWQEDWFLDDTTKQKYWEMGRVTLEEFYSEIKANMPKVKYLEKGFNFKVDNYSFKGEIDRVDEVSGGVEIIDYKTGEPKEKLSFEDKEQLFIYQMAYEEIFKEKVVNLKFYYLNNGTEVNFIAKEKDIIKIKEKLLKSIEGINSCNFSANPNSFICKYCDFKNICPFKE